MDQPTIISSSNNTSSVAAKKRNVIIAISLVVVLALGILVAMYFFVLKPLIDPKPVVADAQTVQEGFAVLKKNDPKAIDTEIAKIEAIEQHDSSPEYVSLLAALYIRSGDYAKAQEKYDILSGMMPFEYTIAKNGWPTPETSLESYKRDIEIGRLAEDPNRSHGTNTGGGE